MNGYQTNIKDILNILQSSQDGLGDSEAQSRLSKHGPNKLAEQERISKLKILIHQFTSPLIYILLISALVTFFLSEYTDTAVILFVVLVNAIIGYVQEYKAERSVRALTRMVVPKAKALRDGQEKEINSEDLVPGDQINMAFGLQVIALAFEPGEKGIIDKPPRSPSEGIMSSLLIQRTVLIGLVISIGVILNFILALRSGDSLEQARTIAVTTMVFFQFFQTWNVRSESASIFGINPFGNPVLLYGMVASIFAHLCVIYVPALQWVFKTSPLSIIEWGEVLLASLTIILAVEIDKWLRRPEKCISC